ncbi:MAG: class I SAM-dependent rRNA methyltransferase, partial [Bacteroidota bacterium]
MQAVYLKKGKEISLMRKHPWVFSGAILKTEGEVEEGSIARVLSSDGKFLGIGHFQNSSISVRIFSFENIEIDRQFWINRIRSAFSYRRELNIFNSNTNCFRLAFGESDHLPGLVLDYYNGNIVFQAHSIGMHKIRETITEALLN